MQPIIKWTGSKRSQAKEIVSYFPKDINTYYEPFLGSASVLYYVNANRYIGNDICMPLMKLWRMIRDNHQELLDSYSLHWNQLQKYGKDYYYEVRKQFNQYQLPEDLFFLSRTCTNGLIRFNKKGEFNSSFHLTRFGIHPTRLSPILYDWSSKVSKVCFTIGDYATPTLWAEKGDFIYFDPPYFHSHTVYMGSFDYEKFYRVLTILKEKKVNYAISLDGIRNTTDKTIQIPKKLYKRHILLYSGTSSYDRIMYKKQTKVYESLYLNY